MTAPIEGIRCHVAPCFCGRCADQRTAETLRLLALDAASVDAAWSGTLDAIRAEGGDPDAVVRRAGEALNAWRSNPFTPEPRR